MLYTTAQKGQAVGIVSEMRQRWLWAALWSEYEALETLVRKRKAKSARGQGYASVAKKYLFGIQYGTPGQEKPTEQTSPSAWKEFGRNLEAGKRWCMLKAKFGIGIFAILPRNSVSNTYIERGGTMAVFTQWMNMVAECNERVFDSSAAIEELYISCMMDRPPPPVLLLEELSDDDVGFCDLVTGLQPAGQSQVEEADTYSEGSVS